MQFGTRRDCTELACTYVVAWTVVIKASSIPNLSLRTLAKGARQFVVHEALETAEAQTKSVSVPLTMESRLVLSSVYSLISSLGSYLSKLTPHTNMGASAEGAEMTTFLAPPFK